MSPAKRDRILVWSVVVFALLLAMPGWYIQMRLAEKINHLEKRVTELEDRLPAIFSTGETPVPLE
jgi:hypothetical protein